MVASLPSLLDFIQRLDAANFSYTTRCTQHDVISIDIADPGQRWEVDFHRDGSIEVEVFKSGGRIFGASKLETLFESFPK